MSAVRSAGLGDFVTLSPVDVPLLVPSGEAISLLSRNGLVDTGLTGAKPGLIALSTRRLRKGLFEARGEGPRSENGVSLVGCKQSHSLQGPNEEHLRIDP